MDLDKLQRNEELLSILARVERECAGKEFSDIVDEADHQYVDLVMEGGGMLGIALVGYTYVLEKAGIRFLGVGGTSAGAINALLITALDKPSEPKGAKLLVELANKNFFDFVDGDSDAKDFIKSWVDGAGNIKLAFKGIQVIDNLQNNLGLNPGTAFVDWLTGILKREGITSFSDLRNRMQTRPKGLRLRSGEPLQKTTEELFKLAIVAADVTTETKVEFPRMAELYWDDVGKLSPALFVRASMSIPYFFYPMRVSDLPRGLAADKRWEELARYHVNEEGSTPNEVMFIDGGIMSNFPIDIFHDTSMVPKAPTFGVKLEFDKRLKEIAGPLGLFGAIFNASRHTLDYDFIFRNPDYKHLVTWIPANGFNWLDFNMSESNRIKLFLEGANCAADFLRGFDWSAYKKIREGMVAEVEAASKYSD